MNSSTPGFPVLHYLTELAQTYVHWVSDAIQTSHLLSSPSPPASGIFPSIRVFSNESAFPISRQRIGASASASITPLELNCFKTQSPLALTISSALYHLLSVVASAPTTPLKLLLLGTPKASLLQKPMSPLRVLTLTDSWPHLTPVTTSCLLGMLFPHFLWAPSPQCCRFFLKLPSPHTLRRRAPCPHGFLTLCLLMSHLSVTRVQKPLLNFWPYTYASNSAQLKVQLLSRFPPVPILSGKHSGLSSLFSPPYLFFHMQP